MVRILNFFKSLGFSWLNLRHHQSEIVSWALAEQMQGLREVQRIHAAEWRNRELRSNMRWS